MNESSYDQTIQESNEELAEETLTVLPENNAYFKLRRVALISTVILVIVIIIILLYLNGKSLYEHGL
ncbi:MAG: hypothetical protein WCK60_00545 [Candidatus Nomurabacteria bacterium]